MRLLPPAARIVGGRMMFEGEDLVDKSDDEMREVRGKRIAMILQDPMASLNPLFTIGNQVGEPIRVHEGASRGKRLGARDRPAEVGAHRLAADPRGAVSARDVGRHAPAHRRRDRHLLRAAPADRRRADHQPRLSPSRRSTSTCCASCSASTAWR
jgi:ABC-type dipeptide/oligopeptide/nickel transport system ATPase component